MAGDYKIIKLTQVGVFMHDVSIVMSFYTIISTVILLQGINGSNYVALEGFLICNVIAEYIEKLFILCKTDYRQFFLRWVIPYSTLSRLWGPNHLAYLRIVMWNESFCHLMYSDLFVGFMSFGVTVLGAIASEATLSYVTLTFSLLIKVLMPFYDIQQKCCGNMLMGTFKKEQNQGRQ